MLLPRPQGRSRLFNGSSGWFSVPSADVSYADPYFTAFLWMKTTTLSADVPFGRWASGTNDWLLSVGTGGKIDYGFGNQQVSTPTGVVIPGRWHSAAFTKNGSAGDSLRGYLDGALSVVSTTATAASCGNSSTLEVGRTAASSTITFFGYIAHVAIWKAALTDEEILMLHCGALPGMIRPALLFGWWPLNGGGVNANTVELDWSGRNKHLGLGGGTVAQSQDYPPLLSPLDLYHDLRYLTSDPGSVAPTNDVAPVASGSPEVGTTLSCTTGTWTATPAPTYAYQWQYNDGTWHDIAGATSSTWVVDVSGVVDVGDTIKCVVTATNGAGSGSADSNTLGPLTAIDFTNHFLGVAVG